MRRTIAIAIASACLALTACGADDGTPSVVPSTTTSLEPTPEPSPGPSTPPQPGDPEEAAAARLVVARYFVALFAGEPKEACAELSAAYQKASIAEGLSVGVNSYDDCPTAITKVGIKAIKEYKLPKGSFKIGVGVTDADSATVPVDAPVGFEDITYVLTKIGTRWYIDGES